MFLLNKKKKNVLEKDKNTDQRIKRLCSGVFWMGGLCIGMSQFYMWDLTGRSMLYVQTPSDAGLHAGRHWSKYGLCKTVRQHVSKWDACDRLETVKSV